MNRVDVIDRPAPLEKRWPANPPNADGQILVPMNIDQRWEQVARLAEQLSSPSDSH